MSSPHRFSAIATRRRGEDTAPYLALLAGLTLVCFALSYLIFLRQEIRSV